MGLVAGRESMGGVMDDDIERFEEERELELYREYRDVLPMFAYVIETERRFYLANRVDVTPAADGRLQVDLADAWVWDMFRPARFVSNVRVMTRRDVNVEELRRDEPSIPDAPEVEGASTGEGAACRRRPVRSRHVRRSVSRAHAGLVRSPRRGPRR